jgi:hypothetical protein
VLMARREAGTGGRGAMVTGKGGSARWRPQGFSCCGQVGRRVLQRMGVLDGPRLSHMDCPHDRTKIASSSTAH